ncbi:type II toxin-antitoxin system RelE family toxin [Pseudorhizobium pelagicum]|uniref:Translation repressor RelE n=1 Tax=Pseudorhizobium pelagicum TaxID=1509405 RepID=A0A922P1X3_9HYPH|nr:type II toxin-antitoxin system RelE/ParE family toxin [Pseudorhizobium pelagicum]KEQ09297.1 translation repressor RelE [Pseudorhizobium pelagicum]KEQ10882.1 translation repressor RelE [Pseudorhizobium pelagicum]
MAWAIEFRAKAEKQLQRLASRDAARIVSFLEDRLAAHENPRELGTALKGETFGLYWRYRVGDYRIICDIQDQRLVVLVIDVGHRREVYR